MWGVQQTNPLLRAVGTLHKSVRSVHSAHRLYLSKKIITPVLLFEKKYVTLQLVMKDGCSMLNTCGLVRNTVLIIG